MRKFLIQTGLFLIILITVIRLHELITPYYWGNPGYVSKVSYLKNTSIKYNTCFIGSSNTYRHIIPSHFDRLTTIDTKSFNLGSPGTFVPETFVFYEGFLQHDKPATLSYVIMELQCVEIAHVPSRYFLTYDAFAFTSDYIKANDKLNPKDQVSSLMALRRNFLENFLKIGILEKTYRFVLGAHSKDESFIGKNMDGFYSLEEEAADLNKMEKYLLRSKGYQQNPAFLVNRHKDNKQICHQEILPDENVAYIQKIQELIRLSDSRGCCLIFCLPPALGSKHYLELLPIFRSIDRQHRIDISDPFEFPEFYKAEYYFDTAHFNNKGAYLYTQRLAEKFNELLIGDNGISMRRPD